MASVQPPKPDLLDIFLDAHEDIQFELICGLAYRRKYHTHWTIDRDTRIINVDSLHGLAFDAESDGQLAHILMAVSTGVVDKIIVETRFTTNYTHWGYKYYDIELECTDIDLKKWFLKYMPMDFPVQFVFNSRRKDRLRVPA